MSFLFQNYMSRSLKTFFWVQVVYLLIVTSSRILKEPPDTLSLYLNTMYEVKILVVDSLTWCFKPNGRVHLKFSATSLHCRPRYFGRSVSGRPFVWLSCGIRSSHTPQGRGLSTRLLAECGGRMPGPGRMPVQSYHIYRSNYTCIKFTPCMGSSTHAVWVLPMVDKAFSLPGADRQEELT